ncbi:conserved hypothetical protein [Neospora caninum Liverpool]|uniref:Uncharacterized protein n=1 Tax=Neospora caninum (strain Liverpool) TaxID=572307 RepID=F0VLD0_NEOCL|nr:conserved hypothetical protein [Neospora caninum Liverpool]CBZ54882.1 conserved hypothetical protein [Neospora caninum Liverpool]CEL69604.1 TPA: hypothetical protein BN1204_053080 [Neospora caninum Liverpool]|eukprot:XP_003884910.1 conserved hypothetical protein [Neospora caninum Liverpool]
MATSTTTTGTAAKEDIHLKHPAEFDGAKVHPWVASFEHFMRIKKVPEKEWANSAKTYFSLNAWEKWMHHEGKEYDKEPRSWEEFKGKVEKVFGHHEKGEDKPERDGKKKP